MCMTIQRVQRNASLRITSRIAKSLPRAAWSLASRPSCLLSEVDSPSLPMTVAWWMASLSLPAVMKTGRYVQREKLAPSHLLKTSTCSSWLLTMSDWRMSSSTPFHASAKKRSDSLPSVAETPSSPCCSSAMPALSFLALPRISTPRPADDAAEKLGTSYTGSTSEISGTASERILRLKCLEAERNRSRTVVNVGTSPMRIVQPSTVPYPAVHSMNQICMSIMYMTSMGAQRTKHTIKFGNWPRPIEGYHHERSRFQMATTAGTSGPIW